MEKRIKPTKHSVTILNRVCKRIPPHLVSKLARDHGVNANQARVATANAAPHFDVPRKAYSQKLDKARDHCKHASSIYHFFTAKSQ